MSLGRVQGRHREFPCLEKTARQCFQLTPERRLSSFAVRMIPNPISLHLFLLRNESSRSTIMEWKHAQRPFAPVLTTGQTGLIPSLWIWTLVLGASCSQLVDWTLLRYGCSQISTRRTIGILLTPSMLRSRTLAKSQKLLLELLSHAVYSSWKRRNKETQKTPCQVSHACGTCGEAQADGTTRNQPCFCRAVEEQRATHRRAVRWFHSRISPACIFAGALKGVLLQPVWSGKRGRGSLRFLKSQCDGREFLQRRLLPCSLPISCRDPCWKECSGRGCTALSFEGGRPWSCVEVSFPYFRCTLQPSELTPG